MRSSFLDARESKVPFPEDRYGGEDENHSSGNTTRSGRTWASRCGGEVEVERTK